MRELSVRAQLTLWYLLVTFAGLLLFGILSYGALQFSLFHGKMSHLQGREQRLIQFLADNTAERTPLPLYEQLRQYASSPTKGICLKYSARMEGCCFRSR